MPAMHLRCYLAVLVAISTAAHAFFFKENHRRIQSNGIRPLPCQSRYSNEEGVCMFAWNCMVNQGTHLSPCFDGIFIGSCCKMQVDTVSSAEENVVIPDIVNPEPTTSTPRPTTTPGLITWRPNEASTNTVTNSSTIQPQEIEFSNTTAPVSTIIVLGGEESTEKTASPEKPTTTVDNIGMNLSPVTSTSIVTSVPETTTSNNSVSETITFIEVTVPHTVQTEMNTAGTETIVIPLQSSTANPITVTEINVTEPTRNTSTAEPVNPKPVVTVRPRPPLVTTRRPVSTTNRPKPQTARPRPTTRRPTVRPRPTTRRPITTTRRPTTTTFRPRPTTKKPSTTTPATTLQPTSTTQNTPPATTVSTIDLTQSDTKPTTETVATTSSSTTQQSTTTSTTTRIPTKRPPTSTSLPVSVKPFTNVPASTSSSIPPTIQVPLKNNSSAQDYKEVCGKPNPGPQGRVVGGVNSRYAEWPWMISLRQLKKNNFLHKCGAALLSEYWAITAAHCVESVTPSDLLLRLGEYDITNEEESEPYEERRVQIIASHPKFDPRTFEYDLALLRFYEPIKFRRNIIPICLPSGENLYVGKMATVTGWGRLYEDGPLPNVLQEVHVPVLTNKECESMYRKAGFVEDIPDIFICSGYSDGGRDSCEGDSGGPMVLKDGNQWVLAGVISWGIGCALPNQPGVYSRITKFSDWINQIIAV